MNASRQMIPFPVALIITLLMALAYTVIDVLQPLEPLQSLLAFLPGLVSLIFLWAAGFKRVDFRLRFSRISRPGAIALGATTVLLLPILGSSTAWTGWQWLPALIFAPASGIAQELYFRAALLPGLESVFDRRERAALVVHALIFIFFHFRTFLAIPSIPIALVVAVVLFLAGCGWGWQVQKDDTVFWAMLQHSLFLILMSMFAWT
jgi:membrane protease YdiL (CAAX protease family)